MAQPDTVQRILDAAESLFADKGFAETSLRQITGKAQVNLAAVNYQSAGPAEHRAVQEAEKPCGMGLRTYPERILPVHGQEVFLR